MLVAYEVRLVMQFFNTLNLFAAEINSYSSGLKRTDHELHSSTKMHSKFQEL